MKKDGSGGPGPGSNPLVMQNPLPAGPSVASQSAPTPSPMDPGAAPAMMSPSMGTAVTPGTYTPQQQMAMAAQGMQPAGGGAPSGPKAPAFPTKIANRPHRTSRGGPKAKTAHKIKLVKQVLHGAHPGATNAFRPSGNAPRKAGF